MKCVIVALALLCSAQALKMDRAPMSARARKHVEMFDEIDRKAGRPERSKIGREEFKKGVYRGTDKSVSDTAIDGVVSWAESNGLAGSLTACQVLHTDAVDLMLCAGDDLAGTSGAGLNDVFCAEIDAWNSDAGDIINEVMDPAIDDAGDNYQTQVAYMKEGDLKKAPFSYDAQMMDAADDYLDGYGIISYVQVTIDGYSFYCDEVVPDTMAELLDENSIGDGETITANAKSAIKSLTKTGVAGATVLSGGKSFGERLKDKYNDWASMKIPVAAENLLKIDIRARRLKSRNHRAWKKGQFRRMGRKPQ